jgi:arginase
MRKLFLIQLPYDSGHLRQRMGRGPDALIDRGLAEHLRSCGNAVEVATVRLPEGLHSEASALLQLQRLTVAYVRDALARGARPILLSGNCGVAALSAPAGLSSQRPAVIWFDAHADFNTPETSDSGYLDGMGLAILTGRCWRRLAAQFESFQPVPDRDIIQIGVRAYDPAELEFIEHSAIRRIAAAQLSDLRTALHELAAACVYVHVDMDVLDVSEGRANGWACSGGLRLGQLYEALDLIARTVPIASGAVTCYDPAVDSDGRIGASIPRIVELLAT